jgi:hypothetical protein
MGGVCATICGGVSGAFVGVCDAAVREVRARTAEESKATIRMVTFLEHFACWYRVNLLLGSRLPVAERTGSAGLLAGCRVDLPVHAALYTIRKNV